MNWLRQFITRTPRIHRVLQETYTMSISVLATIGNNTRRINTSPQVMALVGGHLRNFGNIPTLAFAIFWSVALIFVFFSAIAINYTVFALFWRNRDLAFVVCLIMGILLVQKWINAPDSTQKALKFEIR